MSDEYREYGYHHANATFSAPYVLPAVFELAGKVGTGTRVLDIGCGNGWNAGQFARRGCTVVGVDLSEQGIELARKSHPNVRFEVLAADSSVLQQLNEEPFDIVVSTEVVEHLYSPRPYAAGCFAALKPGGRAILSTPHHGYLKNLVMALTNTFDRHVNPLWDGGHIKFWSRKTLGGLLTEAGFVNLQFRGGGRFPFLWKSMIMSGDRPK